MGIEKESNRIETQLKEAGVRPSPARILIIKAIQESARALSAQEIEDMIETIDRSTITRTLPVLLDAHLIHQFSDGSGSMKYEKCSDHKREDAHNDEHPHFHCMRCGETICLTDIRAHVPRLPQEFKVISSTLLLTGICPKCR